MSSASPPRLRMRSMASSAPLVLDIVALEREDRPAVAVGHRTCLPLGQVDVDGRLLGRDHQHVVFEAVGSVLEGDARAAEPALAAEDLDRVVEACRTEVLDRDRAHHELAAVAAMQEAQMPKVLR